MSFRYLLDTNVISAPFQAHPLPHLVQRLEQHTSECAIAAPTWHELVFGCQLLPPSRKRQALDRYLHEVVRPIYPILPYGRAEAAWHGEERARLRLAGKTPAFVDGQIAATAAVHGLVLVTHNTRDFGDFEGIEMEDWADGVG